MFGNNSIWYGTLNYAMYHMGFKTIRASTPTLLIPRPNNVGYLCVHVVSDKKHKSATIHRLVAEAFLGTPECDGLEVCHNNGNRLDNRAENLRWDSRKNNHADKKKHGTNNDGEKNASAKLSYAQMEEVKEMALKREMPQSQIALMYGISQALVSAIKLGKVWQGPRPTV